MTAPVRYVRSEPPFEGWFAADPITGDALGWLQRSDGEWWAYTTGPLGTFLGTARTRAAATDLILQATGSQT